MFTFFFSKCPKAVLKRKKDQKLLQGCKNHYFYRISCKNRYRDGAVLPLKDRLSHPDAPLARRDRAASYPICASGTSGKNPPAVRARLRQNVGSPPRRGRGCARLRRACEAWPLGRAGMSGMNRFRHCGVLPILPEKGRGTYGWAGKGQKCQIWCAEPASAARPLSVRRYFWKRLVGLSGIVRSISPAERAGVM